MGRKYKDLLGLVFGELTVLRLHERGSAGKHCIWECVCSCGEITYTPSSDLIRGHTKSCGHLTSIIASKTHKKYNEYILEEDFYYGKISDNIYFLIDKNDYNKVKDYKWTLDDGYVCSHDFSDNFKKIRMHRFVLGALSGQIVDHVNRNKLDNRKDNLRLVNHEQNSRNISISKANKTGIIGVSKAENNAWRVTIQGKSFGKRYRNFEDAVFKRLSLEMEIFGKDFFRSSKTPV